MRGWGTAARGAKPTFMRKAAPGFVNNQERAEPYRLARVDSITPNTRILQKGLTSGDGYVRAANIVRIKDALKARNS